ncbi:MAG: hypothetical protein QHH10_10945 [Peptococcaceae bacterium]|jgi:hypothetical protein|nr:hypothetical protein [Peptococcaceae bacterium]MDH7525816.1 hypothetical protein [Peptococcaceae bacterium]
MLTKVVSFLKGEKGYLMLEAVIAILMIGAVTFFVVNSDLLPGLRAKWEMQSDIIQNNWLN